VSYTPSSTFALSSGQYIPESVYYFGYAEGVLGGTLSGVSGSISGLLNLVSGSVSGTLSGVDSGQLTGTVGSSEYQPTTAFIFSAGAEYTLTDAFDFPRSSTLNGYIAGTLTGVGGSIAATYINNIGQLSGTLTGISGDIAAEYDHNVKRYTVADFCGSVDQTAPLHTVARLTQQQTIYLGNDVCVLSAAASMQPLAVPVPVDQIIPSHSEACAPVDATSALAANVLCPIESLQLSRADVCGASDDAAPIVGSFAAVLQMLTLLRSSSCYPVDDASLANRIIIDTIPASSSIVFNFDETHYALAPDFEFTEDPDYRPAIIILPVDLIGSVQFGLIRHDTCAPHQQATPYARHQCYTVQDASRPPPGTSIPIDPPPPPPPPPPEGHETLVIPTQSSYTMQHIVSVVTLVGNVAVPVSKVNLSLNADAFAWQFSAILADPGALSLVEIVDNEPVKLKITIDGYVWHTIVEEIEHSREFGKQAITLKGRGLSALLGGPYEQPHSNAYGSALTVQQLAEMQLPVGWTLNWTQETWLVPANAWSYTNQTPIQALAGIASDTGSMLVPARDSQSLTMMPRYPYWPWDFAGATPDLVIPEAAIKSLSLRPRLGTQANGVYVHGGDVGGVLGWCRFNGTDGARLAETRSNNLMTNVIGCRALGSRILAGQYTQPIVKSLTTYLDGDVFPLAEIGMLAAITIGAETERGIINSVAIEATLSSVNQTIQIGEETPNVWALFKELLPRDPLLVGTMASTDGSTSIITLLDGGVITVRGTGTVGNKYYIRAGRIEGDAPTMTQNEIVV
jgi:hypothetical protein